MAAGSGGGGGPAARELFAEGLLQFLRPAVRQLDGHVHAVRESQVELREHIDSLATGETRRGGWGGHLCTPAVGHSGLLTHTWGAEGCLWRPMSPPPSNHGSLPRAVSHQRGPESGAGPRPLREEAAERPAQGGAGQQHPAERPGGCRGGGPQCFLGDPRAPHYSYPPDKLPLSPRRNGCGG
uniref:Biogenesis of lysosome-related organelles complex 1 subunit 7 n=1 Tax=Calidris pygmaea TaxID=425635 RepID=A0A8C3KHJ3_9CHAR